MMYYIGTYSVLGDQVTAQVEVRQHAVYVGATSVFGLIHGAHLTLLGRVKNGKITGTASAAEVPNVMMSLILTFQGS